MNETYNAVGFTKYKCFESVNAKIDLNSNLSLIIGRNNSGKSSLIDVIEEAYDPSKHHSVNDLYYVVKLTDEHIKTGFTRGCYGDGVIGDHYLYGQKFIGQELSIIKCDSRLCASAEFSKIPIDIGRRCWNTVANSYRSGFPNYNVFRINADRDIVPEVEYDSVIVNSNGIGATNIVRRFINEEGLDEGVVEQTLLCELNKIMSPDATFSQIRVQQIAPSSKDGQKKWEIFLEEKKGRFALSKSGSGLKTIILILINLYIVSRILENSGKNIVFAFEEVENNLHPALQHRLFEYLYNYSIENDFRIFITTHSHVAINTYYGKPGVAIYHVTKNSGISSFVRIENDDRKLSILDDLGVKASDIFQANGIIWVEGPSDRIYIKKWIEVFTPNDVLEGRDYQFAYYGGRSLNHYTCSQQDDGLCDLINVLKTNRNALIVMDSDKKFKGAKINKTKKRVQDEFESSGFYCWITKGKEIENYISKEPLNMAFKAALNQVEQFDHFSDYIKSCDKSFESHKVEFARKISEYITDENSGGVLDVKEKVNQLYNEIKKWQL